MRSNRNGSCVDFLALCASGERDCALLARVDFLCSCSAAVAGHKDESYLLLLTV
jgi:hypothetical protein